MVDLRVMTFNIRNSGAGDGGNRWEARRGLWAGAVRGFGPDLLGVQEVLADQLVDLSVDFREYDWHGVGREDGRDGGERCLILYRRERFEAVDGGDFWLSDTPGAAGSRGWDACLSRICSWVRLRDRAAGRELLFADTHFDHVGAVSLTRSAMLLAEKLPSLAGGAAVVLTGDFNCTEDDEPYRVLTENLIDSYRRVHPVPAADEASFHNFTGTTAGRRIDWILHSPALTAIAAGIDRMRSKDGRCPSDHDAVTAVLRW